jgi:hypothetical protein
MSSNGQNTKEKRRPEKYFSETVFFRARPALFVQGKLKLREFSPRKTLSGNQRKERSGKVCSVYFYAARALP